jgi:hypothetical protein
MENRNLRKERIGIVTSNKMEKVHRCIRGQKGQAPHVWKIRFKDQKIRRTRSTQ